MKHYAKFYAYIYLAYDYLIFFSFLISDSYTT